MSGESSVDVAGADEVPELDADDLEVPGRLGFFDASDPTPGPGSIYQRLSRVLGDVQRIQKLGVNSQHGYNYPLEEDILDAVRPHLSRHGLALWYEVDSIEWLENGRVLVWVEVTLGDETGATLTSRVPGEARDVAQGERQDKGLSKAITAALKPWIQKTFLVSAEDPHQDGTGDPDQGQAGAGRPPQRQTSGGPSCPVCEGPVWDNRKKRKQPGHEKWPDFKCRDDDCDWAIWFDSELPKLVERAKAARQKDIITDGELAGIESRAWAKELAPILGAIRFLDEKVEEHNAKAEQDQKAEASQDSPEPAAQGA